MHALSHSFAHRAPPATRPKLRWQPYCASSLPTSLSSRSSPVSYFHTPASSVSSPPPSSLSELDRLRQSLPSVIKSPKENQFSDQKSKFGLVDQAVKSLCEIWHPQDIPSVFLLSSRPSVAVNLASNSLSSLISKSGSLHITNTQLPSPTTSSQSSSPDSPAPLSSPTNSGQHSDSGAQHRTNLVPIKGFVHEVLRRSRTSRSVLQTALCYLEAIRSRIPELVQRERNGDQTQSDSIGRVEIEDAMRSADPQQSSPNIMMAEPFGLTLTPLSPSNTAAATMDQSQKPRVLHPPLQPLPSLPSPLLCPRRAFLASLILASKFTQDKCYSNRAWAKLSGLPPREIGRCERALGDALEWRLWVGKMPTSPASSSPNPIVHTVVRSQSDGDLSSGTRMTSGWKVPMAPETAGELASSQLSNSNRMHRGLRRCATFPAIGNSEQQHQQQPSTAIAIQSFATAANNPVIFSPDGTRIVSGSDAVMALNSLEPAMCMTPTCVTRSWISSTEEMKTCAGAFSGQTRQAHHLDASPSLATPTLTSSPSSTESSSGDRTIQMTSFIDEQTAAFGRNGCFAPIANENQKVSPPSDGLGFPDVFMSYDPAMGTALDILGHTTEIREGIAISSF